MNSSFDTPYFLLDEKVLRDNINVFKNALNKFWPNSIMAYSIKTNALPWLLKYLKNIDVYAEAVSDEEYELAKMCGYTDKKIIFNGPIKTKLKVIEAVENGAIVNIDSNNELSILKDVRITNSSNVGIRINVNTDIFESEDIGCYEEGFRFGFSENEDNLKIAIKTIKKIIGSNNFGIHLHCNSITRSINVYRAIAKYCVYIVKKYNITPSYIDIGGGFFGGVDGKPNAFDYLSIISDVLSECIDKQKTKLIVEPGSAVIGSAIELYTTVLDSKNTDKSRIITTDGSRIYIDPLWKKSKYNYRIVSNENKCINSKQIICGYTCMDHDRIMIIEDKSKLDVGDVIVYEKVGAYSVTFGGAFIRYLPEVYVKFESGEMLKIRGKFTTKDYYNMQNCVE